MSGEDCAERIGDDDGGGRIASLHVVGGDDRRIDDARSGHARARQARLKSDLYELIGTNLTDARFDAAIGERSFVGVRRVGQGAPIELKRSGDVFELRGKIVGDAHVARGDSAGVAEVDRVAERLAF